jgi:DNA-binding CsgD family transcriptional regulator
MKTRPENALTALTESDYLSFVDRLYEALLPPSSWPIFVERLAELMSCSGGQYLCLEQETGNLLCSFFVGYPTDINISYLDYWSRHDPRLAQAFRFDESPCVCHHKSSSKRTSRDICFHCGFLAPSGIKHMMALTGDTYRGIRPVATLFRGADQPPIGRLESAILERLRPHLVRIMKIHLEYQFHGQRIDLLEQTIHALDYPVFLLEGLGRVAFCNRSAEQWLTVSSHFCVKDGELKARDIDQQVRLARSLRQALSERRRNMLSLRCPGRSKPWQVTFFPLTVQRECPTRTQSACLVIVVDPQARASVTVEDLQSLFGLTSATSRVAIGLAEGKTLQEIATENGVSINTIRSQIRHVMDKTGSHRQAELVSVVTSLPRLRK